MRKSSLSPGVASGLILVGEVSFRAKLFLQMTTLSTAFACMLSRKKKRHCRFHEIQNLRLQLVVDCNLKSNHGLGDRFASTASFFVQELVLSSRSSAVLMTNLADSEVGRNKLVLSFSNLILLPIDHSLRLIHSQKKTLWIDCNTMTVALYCTNVHIRSVLILIVLHSEFVSSTSECINPLFLCPNSEFARHLA